MGRRVRLLAASVVLSGLGLLLYGGMASAAPQEGTGIHITPAQPYLHNPDPSDWLGSYIVGGKQVFCVRFAFLAPDSNQQYQPGQALMTKWGTALPADIAADISFLLLRYGDTKNADEAAALAHLLHSWTAAPQTPDQLLPSNDFRHIAYDADFHLTRMPASTRAAVERLRTDATTNHGPWTTAVTAPKTPQIIGRPANWTITVHNAAGNGLAGVPVTVTVTDGTLAGGKTTNTLTTPNNAGPLTVAVTPTGPNPSVRISLASPADQPTVQEAIQLDVQRIVSTGGEKQLTATATTTAKNAPGSVKISKTNEKTGAAITGVSLRLTGSDKTSPALDQNGKTILGTDGTPAVLVTGADGTATLDNLQTPQDICLVEVSPPPGFDKSFDPAAPPSACGTVTPGATLTLTLANKPNQVPVAVPAGDQPVALGYATSSLLRGWESIAALVGVALMVGGLTGLLIQRRASRKR
jgi:hypothetical protein